MAKTNLKVTGLKSPKDVSKIVDTCRDMDKKAFAEVYPSSDFRSFVDKLMKRSHVFSVEDKNGKFMALFGVFQASSKLGMTWMFSTEEIRKYSIEFARKSKRIFEEIKESKKEIRALVFKEDKISLKWHRWLGFVIINDIGHSYEMALKGRVA